MISGAIPGIVSGGLLGGGSLAIPGSRDVEEPVIGDGPMDRVPVAGVSVGRVLADRIPVGRSMVGRVFGVPKDSR